MIKNRKNQKGFTLIELLVVIAIIAILAVVVVLTLNPAELLRQARDSNRISDFATMKSALALYAIDVSTTTAMYGNQSGDASTDLYTSFATSGINTAFTGPTNWGFLAAEGYATVTSTATRLVDGTGWIPVNLNWISSGAPISSYPIDPVNKGNNLYVYAASTTVFKIATKMESAKYITGGSGDIETGDGGLSTSTYEQGSNVTGL